MTRIFLKGLSLILPIAIAIYVIIWLIQSVEHFVKKVLIFLLPEQYYIPGLGLGILIIITFLIGLLMYPWLTRKFLEFLDNLMRKIPIFGSIYAPVRDLMDMLGGDFTSNLGQPVMIKIPNTQMETLGFLTRQDAKGLPPGFLPAGHVVVYVQWSSQVGGYCFIVPQDHVRKIDLSVEEGMRWALTAGLSSPKN